MEKSSTKKKKPQQEAQSPISPLPMIYIKKAKSKNCLLLSKMDTDKDYKQLRVKLKYPSTFLWKNFSKSEALSCWFRRLSRKAKYLQRFELIEDNMTNNISRVNLIPRLSRIRSLKMSFGDPSWFQSLFIERFGIIAKDFRRLNISSLDVHSSSDIISRDLYFMQHLYKCVKTISNIKSLSLMMGISSKKLDSIASMEHADINLQENQLVWSNNSPLRSLNQIENLRLVFLGPPKLGSELFTQNLNQFQNLKDVEIVSITTIQGQTIAEKLSNPKFLQAVTIHGVIEPNDLFGLVKKSTSLTDLAIKTDWIVTDRSMPILAEMKPKEISLLKFHLHVPLILIREEDVTFIQEFLSIFINLESLQLYLQCQIEKDHILDPIAKQLNTLNRLEDLMLGLSATKGSAVLQFLPLIQGLDRLKKISLTLKSAPHVSWYLPFNALYEGLQSFLLQTKVLEKLQILWGGLNSHHIDCLEDLISQLGELDEFELAYNPTTEVHGVDHQSIMKSLMDMIKQINGANKVSIKTYCIAYETSCISEIKEVEKVAAENTKIKNFYIDIKSKLETPFFKITSYE